MRYETIYGIHTKKQNPDNLRTAVSQLRYVLSHPLTSDVDEVNLGPEPHHRQLREINRVSCIHAVTEYS